MLKGKELGSAIDKAISLKISTGAINSKADVARHFGIKPPSIHDWIKKGSISKDKIPELWRYFSDVVGPEHWGMAEWPMVQYSNDNIIHKYDTGINQANGEAKTPIGNKPTKQLEMESNVSPGPDIKGKVPLISWVQAGNASEVIDLLSPGDAFEWIPSTVQVRDHTFALRVTGDSMMNDFPPGMILIVEPDMQPEIGDFVIAKNGDEEATFKKLVKDAGVMYLKPLNSAYPMIPLEGYTIVGVVRDAVRKLR